LIAPRWDSLNRFADFLTCKIEFVRGLKIHPEIRGGAEVLAQAQGRVSRYVPFASQELIEPVGRHFDEIGKPFGREASFFQFISKNLAWVNRCTGHRLLSFLESITIHQFLRWWGDCRAGWHPAADC
jgi:hypothetical protein